MSWYLRYHCNDLYTLKKKKRKEKNHSVNKKVPCITVSREKRNVRGSQFFRRSLSLDWSCVDLAPRFHGDARWSSWYFFQRSLFFSTIFLARKRRRGTLARSGRTLATRREPFDDRADRKRASSARDRLPTKREASRDVVERVDSCEHAATRVPLRPVSRSIRLRTLN